MLVTDSEPYKSPQNRQKSHQHKNPSATKFSLKKLLTKAYLNFMINLLFLHIHLFLCIFMVSVILSKVSTDHFTLLKLYFENFWKINDLWIWIASWMSPGVIFDPFHLTKDRTNFKMVWLISVTHWPTRSEITISFINSAGYLDSKVVFTHWEPKSKSKMKWIPGNIEYIVNFISDGRSKISKYFKKFKNDSNGWFNRYSSWIFERTLSHAAL